MSTVTTDGRYLHLEQLRLQPKGEPKPLPMDGKTQHELIRVLNYCETDDTEFSGGEDGLKKAVKVLNEWLVQGLTVGR